MFWLVITRHLLAKCNDPSGSLLSASPRTSSPDSWLLTMLTTPDGGGHSELTKAENDGKASDGNEQQPWKMRQCSGRWKGVRGQQHASQAYKWYKKPKD